jgi:hypothetical protein
MSATVAKICPAEVSPSVKCGVWVTVEIYRLNLEYQADQLAGKVKGVIIKTA